ncbi:hypothetical protein [Serratia fonticola]|uniref:hypothetical protein n=2 Tax=Serratia fonticola TaxID=47917 RepID=UPI001AE6FCEC|nr:hypothetical protein [Serratia fonticola]MBP1004259.1 hypothetical protein [Serratia fonticola]MBP1014251.1 hypothetical protein [Serratia fonticola]
MTVTYKEIRERQEQLKAKRDERINRVVSEAVALVNAYFESLQLKNSTWKDIQGVEQPYVFTGVMDLDGSFTTASLSEIELDDNYGLSFNVFTVIDDSPRGGQSIMQSLHLFIDEGVTKVNLQDSGRVLPIIDGNRSKICDAMKDQVLASIGDSALEDTKYF